jgi:hypothetical protein
MITADRKTLSLKEVAGLLCITERRLRDHAASGKVPGAIKLEKLKKWVFSRKAIENYMGIKLENL